LSTCFCLYP